MFLYSLLFSLTLIAGSPYWLLRMLTSGRYRTGLAQRLGRVPPTLISSSTDTRQTIWIHAVSVGEVLVALRLIAALRAARLSCGQPPFRIALSTTTATGQQLARQRLPDAPVFFLPLDLRFAIRPFLLALRPALFITIESELWPRLIHECATARIPIAVANARISDRSLPRYLRLRRLWAPFLRRISLFAAQSPEAAHRLAEIGVSPARILLTGNLKYDLDPLDGSPSSRPLFTLLQTTLLQTTLPPHMNVIIAGSTLEGEETLLLQAWPSILAAAPNTILLLAPRHPERFARVAALIARSGHPMLRASSLLTPHPATGIPTFHPGHILLLDTIGDLASLYALASVAFIGGSLVPAGGHNPLEPARFGVPILMGPSYENFREIVTALLAAQAIEITDPAHLAASLLNLLQNHPQVQALGLRARALAERESGATARTVQALLPLLQTPSPTR